MKRLAEFSVDQSLFVNLMTVFLLVWGGICMSKIKREAFPNVAYDVMQISTIYDGSTPENVERYISSPLEQEIRTVEGIRDYFSISTENTSILLIRIDPDARDKEKVSRDIEKAVDRFTDLPEGAEDPVIEEFSTRHDGPIIEIAVSGDMDPRLLQEEALILEDRLLNIHGVSSILRKGWRDREFRVAVPPETLYKEHISLNEIMTALAGRNMSIPGGSARHDNQTEMILQTSGEFQTKEDIENTVIRSNDRGIQRKLRDLAKVTRTLKKPSVLIRTDGRYAVNLVVIPRDSADAIRTVDEVKKVCDAFVHERQNRIRIAYLNDMSFFIRRRLGILLRNGIVGSFLVLIALFIFLSARTALMTALGIPVSIMIAIIIMYFCNFSVNLISMFGLIMVLGIIVDDAIVVSENVHRHAEMGKSARDATIIGTSEVAKPVTATVLTTVAAFMPLAMMSGIMGKFIIQIPIAVIVTLIASLSECMLVLPSHLADFMHFGATRKEARPPSRWFARLQHLYLHILHMCLKFRYPMIMLLAAAMAASVLAVKTELVPYVMFPSELVEVLQIKAETPMGTSIETTADLATRIEDVVSTLPDEELDHFKSEIGIMQDSQADPFTQRGSHLINIFVFLTPTESRERNDRQIMHALRAKLDAVEGFDHIYIDKVRTGPPVGKPVAIRVRGNDYAVLQMLAGKVENALLKIEGVHDVRHNHEEGKKNLMVEVQYDAASRAGLSVASIGTAVRYAVDGGVATRIRTTDAEDPMDVVVSLENADTLSSDAIEKLLIENPTGKLIPISEVAKLVEAPGPFQIAHHNGKRTITISANIDGDVTTSSRVNHQARRLLSGITKNHPGYSIEFAGEDQDTRESMQSLRHAFVIAVLLIYCILAGTFQSLLHPVMVMLAIPFGLIGVIWTFYFHGQPLSFFTLLGVIGLSGVVVNDSIVLVDFINRLKRKDVDIHEAILEAGKTRLRPVLLTTISTIVGLAPVAYGIGGRDPFLVPMALAMSWGLLFATVLTLIVIPCLYIILNDLTEWFR